MNMMRKRKFILFMGISRGKVFMAEKSMGAGWNGIGIAKGVEKLKTILSQFNKEKKIGE